MKWDRDLTQVRGSISFPCEHQRTSYTGFPSLLSTYYISLVFNSVTRTTASRSITPRFGRKTADGMWLTSV